MFFAALSFFILRPFLTPEGAKKGRGLTSRQKRPPLPTIGGRMPVSPNSFWLFSVKVGIVGAVREPPPIYVVRSDKINTSC